VILMVYVLYLHFLIKSPAQLSSSADKDPEAQQLPTGHSIILQDNTEPPLELPTLPPLPIIGKTTHTEQGGPQPVHTPTGGISYIPEELVENDTISKRASIILLLISAGFISTSAEFLVSSIEHVVANARLTEAFLGLIILPLLGNTAELGTAVTVAIKNKIDLAINVTVGSAIQITLFMAPAMVVMGWVTGRDMTLEFDMFQTVALIVTLVMVNFILLGGRCSALSGLLLFACYIIIGYVHLVSSFSCCQTSFTNMVSIAGLAHMIFLISIRLGVVSGMHIMEFLCSSTWQSSFSLTCHPSKCEWSYLSISGIFSKIALGLGNMPLT
jgi:Ca2+/H+ antiporter